MTEKQHQIFVWGGPYPNHSFTALCGECGGFLAASSDVLHNQGEECPHCGAKYGVDDVDDTGSCNHGVIGNGKRFTDRVLNKSKEIEGKKE